MWNSGSTNQILYNMVCYTRGLFQICCFTFNLKALSALLALTNHISLEKSDKRGIGVSTKKKVDERRTVGVRIGLWRKETNDALEFRGCL